MIFTTAFSNYAIDAIRVEAFDYLMKPICGEDIVATLKRLDKVPIKDELNISESNLIISEMGNKRIIDYKDIIRFQSIGNYTKVYALNNKPILIPLPLKNIESKCPNNFIRSHKSHIVNMSFVNSYNSKESMLLLKDASIVPVSVRKKSAINKLL